MPRVRLLIGTRKGAFIAESDPARRRWRLRGPYLDEGHVVMHMAFDPRSGALFVATGDPWFGSRVYRSRDWGHTWEEPAHGPAFPPESGLKLERVWHVLPGRPEEPGVVYAGVEPAALFKSTDHGETWHFLEGLERHPSRKDWMPSAGGLCLHSIVLDPQDPGRIYVAISAAGAFRSDDAGLTWRAVNKGTRANFFPDQDPVYPEWGQCVHKLLQHPAMPHRLYQQNHCGVYRSDDRAESWTEITANLPSDWGHALALHPHDPNTLYVCQGISGYRHWMPEARVAVFRSRDAGQTWERLTAGLPQRNAYVHVLREGLATDACDPCGVYVGTNTGQLFLSADEGETWRQFPALFPPISSVAAITE